MVEVSEGPFGYSVTEIHAPAPQHRVLVGDPGLRAFDVVNGLFVGSAPPSAALDTPAHKDRTPHRCGRLLSIGPIRRVVQKTVGSNGPSSSEQALCHRSTGRKGVSHHPPRTNMYRASSGSPSDRFLISSSTGCRSRPNNDNAFRHAPPTRTAPACSPLPTPAQPPPARRQPGTAPDHSRHPSSLSFLRAPLATAGNVDQPALLGSRLDRPGPAPRHQTRHL